MNFLSPLEFVRNRATSEWWGLTARIASCFTCLTLSPPPFVSKIYIAINSWETPDSRLQSPRCTRSGVMGPERQGPTFKASFCLYLLPLLAILRGVASDEGPGSLDAFSKASCDFSIELLKSLAKLTEGNKVVSPASVGILLSILQQGARETSLEQLNAVLHLKADQTRVGQTLVLKSIQREKTNVTIEWGSRAYIRPGLEVADAFNATIRDSFGATIQEINFVEPSPAEAALAINTWVQEVTHNGIKDLVSPSVLTNDTVLLLLNGIYFKGLWDVPFSKTLTKTDRFETSPNNSAQASFMSQEERFIAGEDPESGIQWLDLPFKDEQFSMLFLLPSERHGLTQVLEKMTGSLLRNIIDDGQTRIVTIMLPKFKLQEKTLLANSLKELGLRDIFGEDANLEGITPTFKNLRVSKVLHEASVEIDESGSTASAATGFLHEVLSFPKGNDHLKFKADHPFIFFILDKHNKIPLFSGIVVDPS